MDEKTELENILLEKEYEVLPEDPAGRTSNDVNADSKYIPPKSNNKSGGIGCGKIILIAFLILIVGIIGMCKLCAVEEEQGITIPKIIIVDSLSPTWTPTATPYPIATPLPPPTPVLPPSTPVLPPTPVSIIDPKWSLNQTPVMTGGVWNVPAMSGDVWQITGEGFPPNAVVYYSLGSAFSGCTLDYNGGLAGGADGIDGLGKFNSSLPVTFKGVPDLPELNAYEIGVAYYENGVCTQLGHSSAPGGKLTYLTMDANPEWSISPNPVWSGSGGWYVEGQPGDVLYFSGVGYPPDVNIYISIGSFNDQDIYGNCPGDNRYNNTNQSNAQGEFNIPIAVPSLGELGNPEWPVYGYKIDVSFGGYGSTRCTRQDLMTGSGGHFTYFREP